MKKIIIIAAKKRKIYGYGFNVPDKTNIKEMIEEVFKGFDSISIRSISIK